MKFTFRCGSSTRTGTYGYEPYEMPFLQSAVHRIMRDSCQHAGLRSSPSLAVFTIDQIASDLGGYDAYLDAYLVIGSRIPIRTET
jgi:hypothetical protein